MPWVAHSDAAISPSIMSPTKIRIYLSRPSRFGFPLKPIRSLRRSCSLTPYFPDTSQSVKSKQPTALISSWSSASREVDSFACTLISQFPTSHSTSWLATRIDFQSEIVNQLLLGAPIPKDTHWVEKKWGAGKKRSTQWRFDRMLVSRLVDPLNSIYRSNDPQFVLDHLHASSGYHNVWNANG